MLSPGTKRHVTCFATAHSAQPIPAAFVQGGIRDHPTAPRSPWQNGHVERLIGSIRRESLDHLIVFDEAQLRRILKNYASYYNRRRTHLSLNKNAPDFRCPQKLGSIASISILGGLHHQYVRV
jgi:hypothetical protein